MPMPKAIVAQMTRTSSRMNSSWLRERSSRESPAWYGRAEIPADERRAPATRPTRGSARKRCRSLGARRAPRRAAAHRLAFFDDAVAQIRPVEARDEALRRAQSEKADDVVAHALGGRGGERHHRDAGKAFAQRGELAVLGAEVVSPFADAVRLVDGDAARGSSVEAAQKLRHDSRSGAT